MRIIALSLLFAAALTACSSGAPDATEEEIEASAAAGTRDAARVAGMSPGSMEQEGAILDIRARETELREAGFPSCADAYARAAEAELRAKAVI